MVINFREISPAGLDVETTEMVGWLDRKRDDALRELYRLDRPFRVSAHVEKAQENVFVSGSFSGEIGVRCVRCLKDFDLPIEAPFKLTLMPRAAEVEAGKEPEHEIEADDLDFAYYDLEQVDLARVVSEQVLLTLDLYPYCSPECKGLCPGCGANRNEVECACADQRVESRWSALKKFKTGN